MNLWESLISSVQTLRANKLRSFLTILGIVIGVSAVVFLVSFGRGHVANVSAIFESMGANAIYITTASSNSSLSGATGSLTYEDAQAIANPLLAPSATVVAPMTEKISGVTHDNEKVNVTIMGVTPDVQNVLDYPVEIGTFITDSDVRRNASIAVLGYKTSQNLFGTENPVGSAVRIGGRQFEVVGMLQEKGAFMAQMDDFVMIPLTTMQSKLFTQTSARGRPVQTIAVRVADPSLIDQATYEITAILRQRHNIRTGDDDDFNIINMREILDSMQQVMMLFQVFIGSVGSISLVVGGIGIMNIMLVSVTERTREIGIRKAVGARRRDILIQFLVEAAILSLTGGVIGLLIASGGALAVSGIKLGSYAVQAPISIDIVIIALSVAIFVGLISGAYPAFRAASLDPIQSLRHD